METNLPKAPFVAPSILTLEAIYKDKVFEVTTLRQPAWMKDSRRFSYLDVAPESAIVTVWTYDVETGSRTPVVPPAALHLTPEDLPKKPELVSPDAESDEEAPEGKKKPDVLTLHGYQWSPDESQLLFARTPHRRSAQGDSMLFVYTLGDQSVRRVSKGEVEHRNVKWSPDGKRLGYVRDNDLWLLDIATGQETRLTDSGSASVYNGRFGWVYEEELSLVDGWAWSPSGKQIAYFQIDETAVPEIDLPNFDDLHMRPVRTRYPKAGDPNPGVKIGVIDVTTAAPGSPVPPTRWVDVGLETDVYISRLQWTPLGELLLQRIPRLQNKIELLRADPATGSSRVILTESDTAWVDPRGDLTFVAGTNQFVWNSDRTGFNHLYLYDLEGKLLRQLTEGAWDVDALAGIDSTHRLAYFTAARPSPMERHLYSVLLDGGGNVMQISEAPGTHSALFSPDMGHYLDTHSSRAVAPHVRLHRSSGSPIAVVHANPMPRLQNLTLAEWEFTTLTTSDGVTLNAALLRPTDFDPNKRYPALMYTYGGPGSQVVQDSYGSGGGLEQWLASKGYLFVMVDGRGSGCRGRDFLKGTYQNLGHLEVNDQVEGGRWLQSLPYVDPKRVGIWGWSYGGYMACLCITRGAEVFKSAAAVAPVTHWSLYDSIYTERYMRRPVDNPKGYADSSPIAAAEKLKGSFLLVHGLADDNVHFQNSAQLAAEFQKLDKPFRMMVYPGKHHGIEGVSQHVFSLLTDFFTETL